MPPAICNIYYGRWWWPENEKPGSNPIPGSPLPWTGDYIDGLGNKISMVAYANPSETAGKQNKQLNKEGWADGYGLIRFHKQSHEVTFECWPRFTDTSKPKAKQFPGWPVKVKP